MAYILINFYCNVKGDYYGVYKINDTLSPFTLSHNSICDRIVTILGKNKGKKTQHFRERIQLL